MALDGYLGGLDHSAKSHGPEVSRYGVLAFPYVAGALALAFVRILGGALVNTLAGLFRGSKKKAKPKPEQTAVPVQAVACRRDAFACRGDCGKTCGCGEAAGCVP